MSLLNKISLLVFLNLLLSIVCLELYESPNVKTALFTELDVRRSCWNHDDTNLLRARMIMQDLIPRKVPRDLPYLVEYLRSTEEAVVSHSPEGKVRRIMMLALSDVLGGYLQAVAIPMAKEAYYAGNIDYATMARLYESLGDMKSRLRTDGGRWSRPVDMTKFSVKVTALHLPMDNSELACKAMFVTPADSCSPGMSRIAIPYLDYDVKPGAVALPLKSRNLYSLKTAASSHIIVRFYILARQCMSEMPPKDTETFNYHFIHWLSAKVVPHLYEDAWYAGFGSVMRIVETVNETLILQQPRPFYVGNDSSLENSLMKSISCGFLGYLRYIWRYNSWFMMTIIAVILFLLVFCCCGVLLFRRKGYNYMGDKSSSGILNAVLSIYCGLKDQEGSKGVPENIPRNSYVKQADAAPYYRSTVDRPPYQPPPGIREQETETSSVVPSSSEDDDTILSST